MDAELQGKWMLRWITALLWALIATSAVYWGARAAGRSAAPVAPAAAPLAFADDDPARQAAVARLLGAQPAAAAGPGPGLAERFALLGVIASVTGKGAALISVDGQPARPLSVGAQVAPGYLLKAVGRREAVLASDAQLPVQTILSLHVPGAAPAVDEPAASASTAAAPPMTSQIPGAGPPARADSRYPSPPTSSLHQDRPSP